MTFCSYIPPSDAEACCDEAELQEELAEQGAAEGVEPDEEAHKAQRPAEQDAIGHTVHEAHDRAARVGAVVADVERRADEGIDPDDLATFYKVLDQLTRNLEAVDADPAEAFEPLEIQ